MGRVNVGTERARRIEVREAPWYPEWNLQALCRQYPWDWFFDYGRNKKKIDRAKWVCFRCPVRIRCASENLNVPYGIFGGMTWLERWRFQGNTGYPDRRAAYKAFGVRFSASGKSLTMQNEPIRSAPKKRKKSATKSPRRSVKTSRG